MSVRILGPKQIAQTGTTVLSTKLWFRQTSVGEQEQRAITTPQPEFRKWELYGERAPVFDTETATSPWWPSRNGAGRFEYLELTLLLPSILLPRTPVGHIAWQQMGKGAH